MIARLAPKYVTTRNPYQQYGTNVTDLSIFVTTDLSGYIVYFTSLKYIDTPVFLIGLYKNGRQSQISAFYWNKVDVHIIDKWLEFYLGTAVKNSLR